jgi:hypothetical protein
MSDPSRILAWRSRWEQVNAETEREVCQLSPADRLRMVDRLRAFARARGIRSRSDEERQVWERFERLRLVYRARTPRADAASLKGRSP